MHPADSYSRGTPEQQANTPPTKHSVGDEDMMHESPMHNPDPEIIKINSLSHRAMAKMWRFHPSGHPYFDSKLPYYKIFEARFQSLGGMTPELSKEIGWEM